MRKSCCVLLLTLSLASLGMTAGANEATANPEAAVTQDAEARVKDTIEMKYRYLNGHLQCRRWNATQGYWVDPYWRNVT